jgi:hypothetical protein
LIRDSPYDSQTGVNIRAFPAFLQDSREVRTATSASGSPNGGRGADPHRIARGVGQGIMDDFVGAMFDGDLGRMAKKMGKRSNDSSAPH